MVPSQCPSSTWRRKFSTVMGASLGNSSTVKAPCEVSNLIMSSFRDALVSGEVAVRAYITEPGEDKLTADLGALGCAVLEQQPAPGEQVACCAAHQQPQALQCVAAGGERRARLVAQCVQRRVVRRHVRWVAEQQIEDFRAERGVPVPLAQRDADAERLRIALRDAERRRGDVGGNDLPARALACARDA